ncbi:MAG: lycopene cyclase domain-containing protein [Myxococcales bacterium]|nr:lycopene cyclase domain-containing protein [Myxococcales bacterium]MCB9644851.1 lycopene cyclase domain-containing protein [Myxococcales bacterium]
MQVEYLLFNLVILSGPMFLSFMQPTYFLHRWKPAWLSVFVVAIPYIVWDSLVTGTHWFFNGAYTLPFRLAGLPLGELMFFFGVPFACLFSWETLFKPTPRPERKMSLRWLRWGMIFGLVPLGIALYLWGKQYTGLVCFALAGGAAFDAWSESDLLLMPRFYGFLLLVIGLTMVFNGYLTARPIVTYGRAYQLDFRIWTIPIEDFFYGLSHVLWCGVLFEKLKERAPSTVAYPSTHRMLSEASVG